MRFRLRCVLLLACSSIFLAGVATAAGLTITDGCSRSLAGTASSTSPDPLSVDSSGNVNVVGYTGNAYIAGLGQCDPMPADGRPVCSISASQTRIAKGGTVTLYAKCTASTGWVTWATAMNGPQPGANPTTAPSITLTFPNAGTYSYGVVGSSATGVVGPPSPSVTILVGDAADKPSCSVTLSPATIDQGGSSNVRVVCQPEASSYAWDAAEAGAPPPPASSVAGATLTFPTPGAFTYKVAGVSGAGTGPKAGATINVRNTSNCPALPPGLIEVGMPGQGAMTGDLYTSSGQVYDLPFTAVNGMQVQMYNASNTNNPLPSVNMVFSACKGDFTPVSLYCQGTSITVGTSCPLQAGATYYLNIQEVSCSPYFGNTCALRIWRTQ